MSFFNTPIGLIIPIGLIVLVVVGMSFGMWKGGKKAADLKARGIYPETGSGSDADVRRLLESGEKIMAIRCYRELHHVGLREAKEAVELMEQQGA